MKRCLLSLALFSMLLAMACTKEKTPPEPDNCDGISFGYSATIAPIFSNQCAISGCHSSPGDDGGFSLNGLDEIRSAVDAGRPVVEVVDAGDMPPSGPLDALDVDRIQCWVAAGMPG